MCWLAATMSLKVSATFPANPTHVPGSRTVKSPSRIDCRLVSMTARSTASSAALDFPLFFAPAEGWVSAESGAVSLNPALFIISPKERSNQRSSFSYFTVSEFQLAGMLLICNRPNTPGEGHTTTAQGAGNQADLALPAA